MAAEHPVLYLIDGSGYVFRAFHAIPHLSTSSGIPTNATYGFMRMMLKLLKEAHPGHIAVVFDSAKKTFRDDLFEAYKANRPAAPNDLVVQLPFIRRAVEALRIRSLIIDGIEADDTIGTLARQAVRDHMNVVIVTADKDFMQLVSPAITMWDTMRDRRIGVREVRERFGVEPPALVDIMALTGDPIDNVKGVPGIGEKTASALIREFGSLDALLANLGRVAQLNSLRGAKKFATLIESHRSDLELARKLVRIRTDAEIDIRPDQLSWPGPDQRALSELLRELEFHSMLAELEQGQAPNVENTSTEVVVGREDLPRYAGELRGAPALAFHLRAGEIGKPVRLKLASAEGPTLAVEGDLISELRDLLEAPQPPKLCHDLKSHIRAFEPFGIRPGGVVFDTMLAGFLVNPGRSEPSLADLYHEHLAPAGAEPPRDGEPELVRHLEAVLSPRLERDGLGRLFRDVEVPIAAILAEMESTGIRVEPGELKTISVEFSVQMQSLERECFALAGEEFNLSSPVQLRRILFEVLKLPDKGLGRTKSGVSTDADSLTKLAEHHELPGKVLAYRALAKLKSTYADALGALVDPATSRVHTCFHQALTATGRLSSSDPNLQNIPARSEEGRRVRRAFVAEPGFCLISADYSQIELRLLAHLSGDAMLIEAFQRGDDIHARTACELLGTKPGEVDAQARRIAKVINFGLLYGMGPQRLAAELGIAPRTAADYIRRYFERMPGVHEYRERCLAQAREQGFVTTMYGRRRYLPEMSAGPGAARAQAERIALNTPIQGTAADLIKIAMIRLHAALAGLGRACRMVLQVHDELLFEVAERHAVEVAKVVKREMNEAEKLAVPLKVELKYGNNWADLTEMESLTG